jgi:hypothetical protein
MDKVRKPINSVRDSIHTRFHKHSFRHLKVGGGGGGGVDVHTDTQQNGRMSFQKKEIFFCPEYRNF